MRLTAVRAAFGDPVGHAKCASEGELANSEYQLHSESGQQASPQPLNSRARQPWEGSNSLESRIWLATALQQSLRIGADSLVIEVGLADS